MVYTKTTIFSTFSETPVRFLPPLQIRTTINSRVVIVGEADLSTSQEASSVLTFVGALVTLEKNQIA
jgi:hypothetical protein